MKRARTLSELYSFPGFHAAAKLKGVFGDPDVRIVKLRRKKSLAPVPAVIARVARFMTGVCRGYAMWGRVVFASCSNSSACE